MPFHPHDKTYRRKKAGAWFVKHLLAIAPVGGHRILYCLVFLMPIYQNHVYRYFQNRIMRHVPEKSLQVTHKENIFYIPGNGQLA